jgi:hypothetical protein
MRPRGTFESSERPANFFHIFVETPIEEFRETGRYPVINGQISWARFSSNLGIYLKPINFNFTVAPRLVWFHGTEVWSQLKDRARDIVELPKRRLL